MAQKWQFISYYFFGICRTCSGPHVTYEAITFDSIKILTCLAPRNDGQHLIFVKDKYTYDEKFATQGLTKAFYKIIFISEHTCSIMIPISSRVWISCLKSNRCTLPLAKNKVCIKKQSSPKNAVIVRKRIINESITQKSDLQFTTFKNKKFLTWNS